MIAHASGQISVNELTNILKLVKHLNSSRMNKTQEESARNSAV